jgi:ABC-2 type transport system ATP-binding protein
MLQIIDVTKKFGNFTAIDHLSLTIPKGEFFGFLGPNGAGKTTTIKMIAGLFTPTAGEILIDGHNIVTDPTAAKVVMGYIPDQPFMYEKLTGREFFYFVGGLFRIEKKELHKRVDALIEHFDIGEWIDKRAEEYSQGMRQRLTIAAALIHNPKLVVIDEPMVGLDPRSAKIVRDTLRQLSKDGISIFMSTHSLLVAEELCDRVGIINNGKLVFLDTKEKLDVYKQQYDGTLESLFLALTD